MIHAKHTGRIEIVFLDPNMSYFGVGSEWLIVLCVAAFLVAPRSSMHYVEIEMRFLTLSANVCGVCVLLLVRAMLLKGCEKKLNRLGCGFISLRAIVSYLTLPIV